MLPPPTLSFTIPSIHDDLVLQCRVYHPPCLAPTAVSQISRWRKRAAIVAHPYAPLGGSYDCPVVDVVASTILMQGFIVGTFNFRGAGTSKGRTSWQSKAEQKDYMSFIGFMIYYLHHLSPPSPTLPLEHQKFTRSDPDFHDLSPVPSQSVPPPPGYSNPTPLPEQDVPRLLLAGYSYGAMITSSLPPIIRSIIHPFQSPTLGSPHAEIRMRADCLADQQNELMNIRVASLLSQSRHCSRSSQNDDHMLRNPKIRNASGGVRIGGEEDLRRASHDRPRTSFAIDAPETLRRSLDRVRSISKSGRFSLDQANNHHEKKGSESGSSIEHIVANKGTRTPEEQEAIKPIAGIGDDLKTAYLLVSPLHGWANTLATMWSSRGGKEKDFETHVQHTVNPTLAVFGDDDEFVSVKGLRAWVEKLIDVKKDGRISSQFRHREVSGAGHFWNDLDSIRVLQDEVKRFVASL